MIVNETSLHTRSNDTEANNCMSPYGLQQLPKSIPHSQL